MHDTRASHPVKATSCLPAYLCFGVAAGQEFSRWHGGMMELPQYQLVRNAEFRWPGRRGLALSQFLL